MLARILHDTSSPLLYLSGRRGGQRSVVNGSIATSKVVCRVRFLMTHEKSSIQGSFGIEGEPKIESKSMTVATELERLLCIRIRSAAESVGQIFCRE
jgi:hypothetical protein